jgi:hypothetical protein
MRNLKILVQKGLPKNNRNVLLYIMKFLNKVSQFSDKNKMTVDNLATVWAPNLLRAETETVEKIMLDSNYVNSIIRTLIEHVDTMAEGIPPRPSPSQVPISPDRKSAHYKSEMLDSKAKGFLEFVLREEPLPALHRSTVDKLQEGKSPLEQSLDQWEMARINGDLSPSPPLVDSPSPPASPTSQIHSNKFAQSQPKKISVTQLKEVFDFFDENKDGFINEFQAIPAMKRVLSMSFGYEPSNDQIKIAKGYLTGKFLFPFFYLFFVLG